MPQADQDEIIQRLSDIAIARVAPRLTGDPRSDPRKFVDEALVEFSNELSSRVPTSLEEQQSARALGAAYPTPDQRGLLKAAIERKAVELVGLSEEQARITLVDYLVRCLCDARPESVSLAATTLSLTVAEGTKQIDRQGDPLVKELRPFAERGLRMLRGYLGDSLDRANCVRLYSSLELNNFIDIPTTAIVRTLDLRTALNPLGGAVVWVTVGAEVWRGRFGISKGEVVGRFAGGGGGGSASRGEDFTMRGEDFTMRGEDFTMRGEDFTMRGEDFTMRG